MLTSYMVNANRSEGCILDMYAYIILLINYRITARSYLHNLTITTPRATLHGMRVWSEDLKPLH